MYPLQIALKVLRVLRVIPALFEELASARAKAGKKPVHVAAILDVDQRTVERWEQLRNLPLRQGEGGEPGDDLARAVAAYAEVSEQTPFALWDGALKRAKKAEAKLKRGLASTTPAAGDEGAPPKADLGRHLPDDDEDRAESA